MITTKLWKYSVNGATNKMNSNSYSDKFVSTEDGAFTNPSVAYLSERTLVGRVFLDEGTYSVGTYCDSSSHGLGRVYFTPDITSWTTLAGTTYNPDFFTVRYTRASGLSGAKKTFTVIRATWYSVSISYNGALPANSLTYIMLNVGNANYLPYEQYYGTNKGEDYSQYILQGNETVEDLSQEMDSCEVTLQGVSFEKEFDPETKFIMEISDGLRTRSYDWVVDTDMVVKPILSDDNYYTHIISFIEPSVIAQKRVVDNIACTYKLQDVSLERHYDFDINTPLSYDKNDNTPLSSEYSWGKYQCGVNPSATDYSYGYKYTWGKYFNWTSSNDGATPKIKLLQSNGTLITDSFYFTNITAIGSDGNRVGKFELPRPIIRWGRIYGHNKQQVNIGYASFDYSVYQEAPDGTITLVDSGTKISNSVLNSEIDTTIPFKDSWTPQSSHSGDTDLIQHWLCEEIETQPNSANYQVDCYFKKYTDASGSDLSNPVYTNEITFIANCKYTVEISIHEFNDSLPSISGYNEWFRILKSNKSDITSVCRVVRKPESPYDFWQASGDFAWYIRSTINQYNNYCETSFYIYDGSTIPEVLSSAKPYTALALLQKAILNSGNYEKQSGIACNEINHNTNNIYDFNCAFYIDNAFINELSVTQVNENFYNRKNLWEILVDIGYYIHAIPEIKFGESDKLMITFNKLGGTTQRNDNGTKMSITNFKGIDDYICATTSYISNMVQLGGQIEEIVAPKTTSEEYLVFNDTCEIIVSKPILEILSLEVKNISGSYDWVDNNWHNITSSVYEKNIYELLGITANVVPNKGLAIYYELGENKIKGLSYQLPQSSATVYSDYAIKKIIYLAYNTSGTLWQSVKVNDFAFRVKYRTKDLVRQDHVRPDLRKYLLSSRYEKYPQHTQINNQEDILVDSFAFGSNMYGKLIRTSNTTYQTSEWVDNLNDIKHKGELYTIDGELYYVYKVTNTYYVNNIESVIEFSKDYNQLSQVIGIPSEPRFYEISEQSMIYRDKSINDYLLITDNKRQIDITHSNGFLTTLGHLKTLLFGTQSSFAKWVVMTFKGDSDISNTKTFGEKETNISIMLPINAFSSGTTLTYAWDTVDNFSAGDQVGDEDTSYLVTIDSAYRPLVAYQYCDKYGKAPLFDFYILETLPSELTTSQIRALPQSPYTDMSGKSVLASNIRNENDYGLILLKDSREQISCNFNVQAITNSDTFVISPYFFLPNKSDLYVAFLNKEVNKLSNGYIDNSSIISVNGQRLHTLTLETHTYTDEFGNTSVDSFNIDFSGISMTQSEFEQVKAVAIVGKVNIDDTAENIDISSFNKSKFILARNIPSSFTQEQALSKWYFGTPDKTLFTNRQ